MKTKIKHKSQPISKYRKIKIILRRRLSTYLNRLWIAIKLITLLVLVLFIFTNIFSSLKLTAKAKLVQFAAEMGFSLKHIILEGQNYAKIEPILEGLVGKPIFSLNLNNLYQQIAQNPWIEEVVILRRLPNTLHINLIEKRPIAVWQFKQSFFLIDEAGGIIETISRNDNELLQVVGEEANATAKQLLGDMANGPELAAKIVAAIRYGQRRWDLVFSNDLVVKMPENNFNVAWQYLIHLDAQNKLLGNKLLMIDLRDKDRYYFQEQG